MDSVGDRSEERGDCCGGPSASPQKPGTGPEPSCSCGPSCCGPQAEGGSGGMRRIIGLRSLIFILVIAAAIAVAAWSLVKANKTAGDTRSQVAQGMVVARGNVDVASLGSSPTLGDVAPGKDFAFVLLAGSDRDETMSVTRVIQQVSATLGKKGINAGAVVIQRQDGDFEKFVSALGIDKLPAVVLLGKACGPSVVAGELTEDVLLRDYVRATSASACAPGACGAEASASGCCPGK